MSNELNLFQKYMKLVGEDRVPAPTCGGCQSVLLYYLDDDGFVFWRCTGCDRVSYPGLRAINEMRDAVERFY